MTLDIDVQLAVVSVLIKEKKQLRDAVRRCEETENRIERIKNEPYVLASESFRRTDAPV